MLAAIRSMQNEHLPSTSTSRNMQHISPTAPPSRGGCWTCRIRRKKCDEEHIGESCRTCLRLKIECLGWGSPRPAWMRDKQRVEEYKAGIKAQLRDAGMIRGIPRPPANPTPSTSLTNSGSASSVATPSSSSSGSLSVPHTPNYFLHPQQQLYHQAGPTAQYPNSQAQQQIMAYQAHLQQQSQQQATFLPGVFGPGPTQLYRPGYHATASAASPSSASGPASTPSPATLNSAALHSSPAFHQIDELDYFSGTNTPTHGMPSSHQHHQQTQIVPSQSHHIQNFTLAHGHAPVTAPIHHHLAPQQQQPPSAPSSSSTHAQQQHQQQHQHQQQQQPPTLRIIDPTHVHFSNSAHIAPVSAYARNMQARNAPHRQHSHPGSYHSSSPSSLSSVHLPTSISTPSTPAPLSAAPLSSSSSASTLASFFSPQTSVPQMSPLSAVGENSSNVAPQFNFGGMTTSQSHGLGLGLHTGQRPQSTPAQAQGQQLSSSPGPISSSSSSSSSGSPAAAYLYSQQHQHQHQQQLGIAGYGQQVHSHSLGLGLGLHGINMGNTGGANTNLNALNVGLGMDIDAGSSNSSSVSSSALTLGHEFGMGGGLGEMGGMSHMGCDINSAGMGLGVGLGQEGFTMGNLDSGLQPMMHGGAGSSSSTFHSGQQTELKDQLAPGNGSGSGSSSTTTPTKPEGQAQAQAHAQAGLNYSMPYIQPPHSDREEDLVAYYFQNVLPQQYACAPEALTGVLHEIIVQEPLGAVTNACCALACLHRSLHTPSQSHHQQPQFHQFINPSSPQTVQAVPADHEDGQQRVAFAAQSSSSSQHESQTLQIAQPQFPHGPDDGRPGHSGGPPRPTSSLSHSSRSNLSTASGRSANSPLTSSSVATTSRATQAETSSSVAIVSSSSPRSATIGSPLPDSSASQTQNNNSQTVTPTRLVPQQSQTQIGLDLQDSFVKEQYQLRSQAFFEKAYWQIANSKVLHGRYSESDAIAALQLVSYDVLAGTGGSRSVSGHDTSMSEDVPMATGIAIPHRDTSTSPSHPLTLKTDWSSNLDFACEWLHQTITMEDSNPRMTFVNLNEIAKVAVKMTLWLDIFRSITHLEAPRFLSLHRRLLGGGAGFWAQSTSDLHMEVLTGCRDNVVLALAETAALSAWKTKEADRGTLSVHELVRKAEMIEKTMKSTTSSSRGKRVERSASAASSYGSSEHQMNVTGHLLLSQSPAPSPTAHSPSSVSASSPSTSSSLGWIVHSLGNIFQETALLYLHTVVSDVFPGVPEVESAVQSAMSSLESVSPSILDRALIFALFMIGCMTNNHTFRNKIQHRISLQNEAFGNLRNARLLMEHVWRRRDEASGTPPVTGNRNTNIHWRLVMQDMGIDLLFV